MSESGRTEKRTMESASCVANREYQGQQYRPVGWPQHAHNAYPRVEAQADKDGGDCHRRHRRGHQRAAVRLIPGIGHDAVSRPACARRRRRQSPKGQEPNKIASRCSSRRLSSLLPLESTWSPSTLAPTTWTGQLIDSRREVKCFSDMCPRSPIPCSPFFLLA